MGKHWFEKYAFWLSIVATLVSLSVTAGMFAYGTKQMASFEDDNSRQDILIQQAINAAHEKELQCKDMVHHFSMIKSNYEYCK